MKKLPQCGGKHTEGNCCKFNAHSNYLVCAIHPSGVEGDLCPDFLLDPEYKESWSPIGFTFIDDQLFRKPVTYQVDFHPTLKRSQQWEILETHPFFTGVCPNCGAAYPQNVKIIHYDCQSCGWMDDSLG